MKIIKRNERKSNWNIYVTNTQKKKFHTGLQIIALLLFSALRKKTYVYRLSLIMESFLSYQIKRSVCIILQLVNFLPVVLFCTNFSTSAHQKLLTLCNRYYFKFYWSKNDLNVCLIYLHGFSFINDKFKRELKSAVQNNTQGYRNTLT